MGSKFVIFIGTLSVIFNAVHSQALNRILPNCGLIADTFLPSISNQLNYLPYDLPYEILPNIYPGAIQPNGLPLPTVLQSLPNMIQPLPNALQTLPNVLQPGIVSPIIQENPVAMNLANALQLIVVSNLLRNTLPQARDVVVPGLPGYPPIEYIQSAPCGVNYLY